MLGARALVHLTLYRKSSVDNNPMTNLHNICVQISFISFSVATVAATDTTKTGTKYTYKRFDVRNKLYVNRELTQ